MGSNFHSFPMSLYMHFFAIMIRGDGLQIQYIVPYVWPAWNWMRKHNKKTVSALYQQFHILDTFEGVLNYIISATGN